MYCSIMFYMSGNEKLSGMNVNKNKNFDQKMAVWSKNSLFLLFFLEL